MNNKKINLYDKSGWLDWNNIVKAATDFNFVTGGRGIGKTFGLLKYLISNNKPFIFMRRTQTEADLQSSKLTSDLQKVFDHLHIEAVYDTIAKGRVGVISDGERNVCATVALSTFASIRGVNFDEYDYLVYDEFIPEPHVRAIKMEDFALKQCYESINRNRELEGRKPLKLFALSNSLNLANAIFIGFGAIETAEKMSRSEDEIAYFGGNKLLIMPKHSPISERKKKTALYNNDDSEEFAKMALNNDFSLNDFSYVRKEPIAEYRCFMKIDQLYIYKHKSNRRFYITFTKARTHRQYSNSHNDLTRFSRENNYLWNAYLDGHVRFDTYKAVALFEKYFTN